MTSRRVWVRQLWSEQPGLHRGYVVDLVTAILVAVALILGGAERTTAPAWHTLNENGGPVAWGVVFAVVAVALIAATFVSGRAMMVALWLAAALYALLGWWFLREALPVDAPASFIGAIMFLRAAVMHLSRGAAYYVGSMNSPT